MKRVLLAFGLILLVLLILGFIAPKEYVTQRHVEIDLPGNVIYKHINSLEELHRWTDPVFLDSSTIVTYEGTPGTVGSSAHWKNNLNRVAGKEEILLVVPLNRLETRIRSLVPWESLSHSFYSIQGNGRESSLEWRYEAHCPFPFNIKHLFVDMSFVKGEEMQTSLTRLKNQSEEAYLINELGAVFSSTPETTYLIDSEARSRHIDNESYALQKGKSWRDELGNQIQMPLMPGIFIFEPTSSDSMMVTVYTKLASETEIKGKETIILPQSESMVVEHIGSYKELSICHNKIRKLLNMKGETFNYPIELTYIVNPINEPDTAKWLTSIRYRLK